MLSNLHYIVHIQWFMLISLKPTYFDMICRVFSKNVFGQVFIPACCFCEIMILVKLYCINSDVLITSEGRLFLSQYCVSQVESVFKQCERYTFIRFVLAPGGEALFSLSLECHYSQTSLKQVPQDFFFFVFKAPWA